MDLDEDFPAPKNRKPEIDADFLEQAAANATYSTQQKSSSQIKPATNNQDNYITVNGRNIPVTTKEVDASESIVWEGNPRNFEIVDVDTSDLWPLISDHKGNTIPVYARVVQRGGKDLVQIIAGSRRRLCCIKGGFRLLVSLIDCSDAEARVLTQQENLGRKSTSFLADCRWHLATFNKLKEEAELSGDKFTQEMYAKSINCGTTKAHDYFKFAEFPDWLTTSVNNPDSWSYRSCNNIRTFLNQDAVKLNTVCKSKHETANDLIKAMTQRPELSNRKPAKRTSSNPVSAKKMNRELEVEAKTENTPNDSNIIYEKKFDLLGLSEAISFTKRKTGTTIEINRKVHPDLINQIEEVIKNFTS